MRLCISRATRVSPSRRRAATGAYSQTRPNWQERPAGESLTGGAMDRLTDDERRLLELLAGSANGVSEPLLVTRFTLDMMAGLVRERLATATQVITGLAGAIL